MIMTQKVIMIRLKSKNGDKYNIHKIKTTLF